MLIHFSKITKKYNMKIHGKILSRYNEILSDDALKFIRAIHENFNNARLKLVSERGKRQKAIDNNVKLDFFKETEKIRNSDWKIKNVGLLPERG